MKIFTSHKPPQRVAWYIVKMYAGKLVAGKTDEGKICRIAFLHGKKAADIITLWQKEWPNTEFYRKQNLAIPSKEFAEKKVLLVGTAFQCKVWKAMTKIPFGQTRTYGALARRIGKPEASRAVGQACGANPVPFLIPCHRVVAADGLGGFSGGLDIKKMLLNKEKASL
ncbi:MAG: methylated-DNA--[protein]-cysteine S-methyltransferase [Bdellovibrionales bacterium]